MHTKTTLSKNPIKIEVSLVGMTKPVRRVLFVPGDINFQRLHHAIQSAFMWNDEGSYEFMDDLNRPKFKIGEFYRKSTKDGKFLSPIRTYLQRKFLINGNAAPFYYVYKNKYKWPHIITFQEITSADRDQYTGSETLLDCEGICPPENIGGPEAYKIFRNIVNDPKNPFRQPLLDLVEWNLEDLNEEIDAEEIIGWFEDFMEGYDEIRMEESLSRKYENAEKRRQKLKLSE